MFSFTLPRLRLADWRDWLPPAILLAALASIFALGGDRGYLYRDGGIHNQTSIKTLGIVENLSREHNFLLARWIWEDENGEFEYFPYGQFPIGGFALAKLVIAPFGSDIPAKLMAARVAMILMFCGAALCAYLALARIAGSRRIALAATLLAFSSFYAVYYADAVSNESVMDLFGAMLAFHGMAVFVQEGRFRQLLAKTCAALLLGWHVYALLLPFIAFGFGGEMMALIRSAGARGGGIRAARAALRALVRSRFAILAVASIAFGAALLGFNLANEYAVTEGARSPLDLKTLQSAIRRVGLDDALVYDDTERLLEWDNFLTRQFYRAGVMVLPYATVRAAGYDFKQPEPLEPPIAPAVVGVAAAAAALAGLAFVRRYRLLFATLALFGLCWALPMRNNTHLLHHAFEGLPFIGLSLTLFAFALMGARRLIGERSFGRVSLGIGAAAALAFAASVYIEGRNDRDPNQAEWSEAVLADFSAIGEIARGKRVVVVSRPSHEGEGLYHWRWSYISYYLGGSYISRAHHCENENPADADFTLSLYRIEGMDTLTPQNRIAFLYPPTNPLEICRAERRRLEASEPTARASYDVYLETGESRLLYLKSPCGPADYETPFFAYVHPADANDLPRDSRRDGFQSLGTARASERGAAFDGACLVTAYLPDYPISAVRTGQYIPGGERLWDVFAIPPMSAAAADIYEKMYRAVAEGEPSARAEFDLYLEDGALTYLKEPCGADDARGRFFLSVHPADAGDLPPHRREAGHWSLNFDFAPPIGAVFNGKCMATRQLPDYEIEKIETGQWIPGGERLWAAEIAVGDGD